MAEGFGVPGWGEIFTPWAWMPMVQNRNRVVGIRCFIIEDLS
jgi:hypothetical protein